MSPEDYQEADHAAAAAWFADATLATNLGAISTWAGFKASLDELSSALTEPSIPPALPAAGASWIVRYPREVLSYLNNDVRMRRAVVDVTIRLDPTASSTAWTTLLAIANRIKARVDALAATTAQPIISVPLALLTPDRDWPQGRLLIPTWMGET